METLILKSQIGHENIPSADILYLQSDTNYTEIFTINHPKRLCSITLKKVENRLDNMAFLRINRGLTINRLHVSQLCKSEKQPFVILSNGQQLPISRRRFGFVKQTLEIA
jgi:DNA-binding LytR/AlgR family response regulator